MFVRPWQAINHTIYTDPASPSTSMSLDVWGSLEGHLAVLNGHNISVQFFMGFNAQGPNAGDLRWASMSEQTQRWWVSYVVARLAPFANIIGYQFSSETKGNDPKSDYGLATMLQQADPFHHGRTCMGSPAHDRVTTALPCRHARSHTDPMCPCPKASGSPTTLVTGLCTPPPAQTRR